MAFRERYSATIVIAYKIIWSMSPSSSLPIIPPLHSCHLLLLLTEETGPRLNWVKKPPSIPLLWLDHHIDRLVLPGLKRRSPILFAFIIAAPASIIMGSSLRPVGGKIAHIANPGEM